MLNLKPLLDVPTKLVFLIGMDRTWSVEVKKKGSQKIGIRTKIINHN